MSRILDLLNGDTTLLTVNKRLASGLRARYDHRQAVLGKTEQDEVHLRRAKGCPACGGTGYQGRTGIYEVIRVDNRMRALIHDQAAEAQLESAAREQTPSIMEDGIRKVLAGLTTLDEVLRVTRSE